ncbi:CLUMA_CG008634, isoform A [Clunio marinus]|uniref:CLUMA_CG008634, isoform A n=1 Tax=Clunio marinus TaxID=568069 RepID=A0A1J1I4E3_9DIPT|nr:CLUMA_CG008634, isoform A [Clunio marinus]
MFGVHQLLREEYIIPDEKITKITFQKIAERFLKFYNR